MLELIRGEGYAWVNSETLSDRKLRFFVCAYCRAIWHLLKDKRSRKAVKIGEQFADGLVTEEQLEKAHHSALTIAVAPPEERRPGDFILRRWAMVAHLATNGKLLLRSQITMEFPDLLTDLNADSIAQPCEILRDIFGNPFRPIALDPRWLTSSVLDLARSIYDERAFDRLPILADALMDAGCDHDEIISHCRTEGPHVRGCWVVCLLLGKK
jgi:hypothetical protein